MNKTLTLISLVIAVIASLAAITLNSQYSDCLEQLRQSENNNKSLLLVQDSLKLNNRTLQFSIEQLNYFNDSISNSLKKSIKELEIDKDKIKQLQYMLSTNTKVDTIYFPGDTVFVENTNIDTTVTDDKWYSVKLKLQSPNKVIVSPKFKNEFTTIFSAEKETINPPKKCFIGRWFQRKHIVTKTTIVNNNPYSTVDTTRFIEIVKL